MLVPVVVVLDGDLVVEAVIVGALLASIWTWAVIMGHALRIKEVARENERFERDFWKAQDIDRFHEAHGREDWPSAKLFSAGIAEWRRSTRSKALDRDGTRARLATAMHGAVAEIGRAHD